MSITNTSSTAIIPLRVIVRREGDSEESTTLRAILDMCHERGVSLDAQVTASVACYVLDALVQLHTRGNVFGAIAPDDIRVSCSPSDIKSVDIEPLENHPSQGSVSRMRFRYAAPEVVAFGERTAAADVYSLGIILGECLYGEMFFQLLDTRPLYAIFDSISYDPNCWHRDGQGGDNSILLLISVMVRREPEKRPPAPDLLRVLRRPGGEKGLVLADTLREDCR